jgi:hypothetical protein
MTDRHVFEVRLRGRLGRAALQAFAGLDVEVEPATTVLTGVLDQDELHALLDRVQSLGLELLDITSDRADQQ